MKACPKICPVGHLVPKILVLCPMPKWTVWVWAVIMDFVAQVNNKREFLNNPNNLNNPSNPCNPYNPNPLNVNGVDRVYTLPGPSHCTPVKAFNQALEVSQY